MKHTLLINPGVSSLNIGDEIIADAVIKQLSFIIDDTFITSVSSHLPLSFMYKRAIGHCDYKFVCGSNLLMGKMNGLFKQWHIDYFDRKFLKDAVLVGAGWWQYGNKPNLYTKKLYKSILNKNILHSVRDNYTVKMLNSMGIYNVINTGCATMWNLTPEHCNKIPKCKSDSVVFTLTDYNIDEESDKKLIELLLHNYKNIYFWPQGVGDYEYINKIYDDKKIVILNPSLKAYDELLDSKDIDFIGTRLHGGIRALQKKKRTIIVAIDNRAKEKQRDFNIKCVDRKEFDELEKLINSSWATEIKIPLENINKWKSQFSNGGKDK